MGGLQSYLAPACRTASQLGRQPSPGNVSWPEARGQRRRNRGGHPSSKLGGASPSNDYFFRVKHQLYYCSAGFFWATPFLLRHVCSTVCSGDCYSRGWTGPPTQDRPGLFQRRNMLSECILLTCGCEEADRVQCVDAPGERLGGRVLRAGAGKNELNLHRPAPRKGIKGRRPSWVFAMFCKISPTNNTYLGRLGDGWATSK